MWHYTFDKCIYMGSHSLLGSKLSISCKGYNVHLQTAVAAILVFVECPKSSVKGLSGLKVILKYTKSIRQAVFNLLCSQAIFHIEYNVNLQTAVAAILVFVECPKSIASEVFVVLRPYQNVKSIKQAVFYLPHSQTISCIGYNVNLQTAVAAMNSMYLIYTYHFGSSTNSYTLSSNISSLTKCNILVPVGNSHSHVIKQGFILKQAVHENHPLLQSFHTILPSVLECVHNYAHLLSECQYGRLFPDFLPVVFVKYTLLKYI